MVRLGTMVVGFWMDVGGGAVIVAWGGVDATPANYYMRDVSDFSFFSWLKKRTTLMGFGVGFSMCVGGSAFLFRGNCPALKATSRTRFNGIFYSEGFSSVWGFGMDVITEWYGA